jgi:flavin reductase (DIM6/NTAB) family NADH-FMN oxidoreductase RutF
MILIPGEADARQLALTFKSVIVPRPIGWISTRDAQGRFNLAPYSFFNAIDDAPPMVMFSSNGRKDTIANAEATGVFACNIVTEVLANAMNETAATLPHGDSEFGHAGLAVAPCLQIDCPSVRDAASVLECIVIDIVRPKLRSGVVTDSYVVFGEVVCLRISDDWLDARGRPDLAAQPVIGRLGGSNYAAIREQFQLQRPR